MRTLKLLAIAALCASTAACAAVNETIATPQLQPMGYPTALVPQNQPLNFTPPGQQPHAASANSLWRAGARAFFIDQRAKSVGDILTVSIDIDDRASTTNTSTSSRSTAANVGVSNFLGLESSIGRLFPDAFDPAALVGTEGSSSNSGNGAINRQERISLTVAAVVTQVLANGNMVIQGTQEVRTNNEVRQLTVAGIVRPEDITAQNTIRHSQIAEARIAYGGRGDLSRVQKVPAGQALVERFSPF